jgi:hypothetical protein
VHGSCGSGPGGKRQYYRAQQQRCPFFPDFHEVLSPFIKATPLIPE